MGRVKSTLEDGIPDTEFGYVYCLSNPAMPGLVKIGFTNRSAILRAEELSFGTRDSSATGVPMPFEVVRDWQVPPDRAREIEQLIHKLLQQHRVPPHGRWKAKEFFYLEPDRAISAIENALKRMDWWAVTQASKERFDSALRERQHRQVSRIKLKKIISEAESVALNSIKLKKNQWQEHVSAGMQQQCQIHGLKWAAAWFFGSLIVFDSLGAKDSAVWGYVFIGFLAYSMTKDDPLNKHLKSPEFLDSMQKIEDEETRNAAIGPIDVFCPACTTELTLKSVRLYSDQKVKCPTCRDEFAWRAL